VIPHAPANVEAEQALLGTILDDNAAFERIGDYLQLAIFMSRFISGSTPSSRHIRKGQLAEPILLAEQFSRDPAFESCGVRYPADLVHRVAAANAQDYARAIYELAIRRDLIRIGGEISVSAAAPDPDKSARDQIEFAEAQLYALLKPEPPIRIYFLRRALHGAVAMVAEAHSRDGGLAGISTGLIDLDQKIGGLHPSDLRVVRPAPREEPQELGQ